MIALLKPESVSRTQHGIISSTPYGVPGLISAVNGRTAAWTSEYNRLQQAIADTWKAIDDLERAKRADDAYGDEELISDTATLEASISVSTRHVVQKKHYFAGVWTLDPPSYGAWTTQPPRRQSGDMPSGDE